MSQTPPIQIWSVSVNGADAEAALLLTEAERRETPALVDLGHGERYLGWHPLLARFAIHRRAAAAPESLPAYLASLEAARHVHAGGDSAEGALEALLALFERVARRLED